MMRSKDYYSKVDAEYGSTQIQANRDPNDERGLFVKKVSRYAAVAFGCFCIAGIVVNHFKKFDSHLNDFKSKAKASFDDEGRFVIKNYDKKEGFCSFLPAIAGKYGIPMWAFYLNRGQAIASFGIQSKDGSIYEFESATKAFQQTPLTGFRTFLKIKNENDLAYQPFYSEDVGSPERNMYVGMNEVEIEDVNQHLGLQTSVLYFNLPEEKFPGLVRAVTFTNLKGKKIDVEALDGPVKFLPYGISDPPMKNLPTTEEAWFKVYNMDIDPTLPWYRETSSTADTDIVTPIVKGHYAVSWLSTGERLPYLADPDVVFGWDKTFAEAREFLDDDLDNLLNKTQSPIARTPVALAGTKFELNKVGDTFTIYSLYGMAESLDALVSYVVPRVTVNGYIEEKRARAKELLKEVTAPVATETANPIFDAFVQYNFMDNVLRGGMPVVFGTSEETQKVYHIYSRIHGDLERDYNAFNIDPTYFSQGPGNFRDVNQNRRTEVLFTPEMGPDNAIVFYSLIQADAYNPLTVASPTWILTPEDKADILAVAVKAGDDTTFKSLDSVLSNYQLNPGAIGMYAYDNPSLLLSADDLLDLVADKATSYINAAYGEGYWSDHWSYNLDLIDSYLTVFPDKLEELLWGPKLLRWFISPTYVLPRSIKYVLLNGTPRQTAPTVYKNPANAPHLNWPCDTWQCVAGTEASNYIPWESYEVPFVTKVLALGVIKYAILDPYGMGVEMEGGKPGWLDAMNGLPSLFGSTMPEAFELYRTIDFLHGAMVFGNDVVVPEELDVLMQVIQTELTANLAGGDDFTYWDNVRTALEEYRAKVTTTFTGNEVTWTSDSLGALLGDMLSKMDIGVAKSLELNGGITPTYFTWTPTKYKMLNTTYNGYPNIKVLGMEPEPLPMYLEGSVRHFKIMKNFQDKLDLYDQVASSAVRDEELLMYKICENIEDQDAATGRIKSFPRGWLEHESIWLHMSYKFYLEVLRAGLYDQFWTEAMTGLTPFMDPEVYGRSPLEASSFIASSAFPDKSKHGEGFVSRLSGSTAEFTSMWNLMMTGPKPFTVDEDNQLYLEFAPALPNFLFTKSGTISYTFLGSIMVTYYNPLGLSTWDDEMEIKSVVLNNGTDTLTIDGGVIGPGYSSLVRRKAFSSIDIYYG